MKLLYRLQHLVHRLQAVAAGVVDISCALAELPVTLAGWRAARRQAREALASPRTRAALAAARDCAHTPPCPPPGSPDRLHARVVYRDATYVYLCGGLVLNVAAPARKRAVPARDATRPRTVEEVTVQ